MKNQTLRGQRAIFQGKTGNDLVTFLFFLFWSYWRTETPGKCDCGFKHWLEGREYDMVFNFGGRTIGWNDGGLALSIPSQHNILSIIIRWTVRSCTKINEKIRIKPKSCYGQHICYESLGNDQQCCSAGWGSFPNKQGWYGTRQFRSVQMWVYSSKNSSQIQTIASLSLSAANSADSGSSTNNSSTTE